MITRQAATAVATYLRDNAPVEDVPAANIYAHGQRGPAGTDADAEEDSTTLPRILVTATNGTHLRGSGNWTVGVNVELHSDGDDADVDAAHAARCDAMAALLMPDEVETLVASLSSSIADFTCFGAEIQGVSHSVEGRRQICTLTISILCCPSDIS